ncbi:MAG TPA: alpha/beta hydrolase [Acidimicrobiales bacterium]|nr:alpha/beta hydrolase [Acidimicrobiales bacterium]
MGAVTRARVKGNIGLEPGRRLSFASFGPSDGKAFVWLHGTPGAATQVPDDARIRAERDGLRIIGVDRPGVGGSTPHLYDDIVHFATDLERLLDALDIDDVGLIGLSGGGPYALAGAARLGSRVRAVGVLGGVAPTVGADALGGGVVALTRFFQPLLRAGRIPIGQGLAGLVWTLTPLANQAIGLYARISPEADRVLLNEPAFKEVFLGDLTRRANRQFSAPIADVILFGRDWGFTLDDVRAPVHWWHGTEDNIIPFAHGEAMVERLADASFHPVTGGGHLAGFGVGTDVLDALVAY